jgi:hypothetical protein
MRDHMNPALIAIALSLFTVCLSSCSHTWVGQTFLYPPTLKPLESNQAEFKVIVEADGATGKAYIDRTKKQVYVWLNKRSVTKAHFQYTLHAADLNFDVTWYAPGDCTLHFYDLPDGVSSYDQNAKTLRKEILSKHYHYDDKSDVFSEQSTP